jgi:pimeloyl-ACP methyl ester carboxylesterase
MGEHILFQGKQINYKISGSGNTIVLLHGFIEDLQIWSEFVNLLSPNFRVISIDLPGHGQSEVISDVHSMQLMADSVIAVLKSEMIDKAVFVGHSMGGYVALAVAKQYPEFVNGLVLFHSQAAEDSEAAKINRDRTVRIVEQNKGGFILQFIPDLFDPANVDQHRERIQTLIQDASRLKPEGIIAAIKGMRERESRIDVLAEANFPVLFISGKKDTRIPISLVMEQAAIPEHSEILVLDHVGHMGYIEAPDVTFRVLWDFSLRCWKD